MTVNGSFAKDLTIYANRLHVCFIVFFLSFQDALHGLLLVCIHFAKSEIFTEFLRCCSVFSYPLFLASFIYSYLFFSKWIICLFYRLGMGEYSVALHWKQRGTVRSTILCIKFEKVEIEKKNRNVHSGKWYFPSCIVPVALNQGLRGPLVQMDWMCDFGCTEGSAV